LAGICLYPVLGMPEWHDRERWTRMGLWDLEHGPSGLRRARHVAALDALARAQSAVESWQAPPDSAIAESNGCPTRATGTE
jgi:hypothetical protein